MKQLYSLFIAIIVLVSCAKEAPKDYVTFSGKLENNTDSILTISNRTGILKTIIIHKNGTFKDTLKVVKEEMYTLQSSPSKRAPLFLKNGYDLKLVGNSNDYLNSFIYSGEGSSSNNFIVSQYMFSQKMGNPMDLFALEKDVFDKKTTAIVKGFDSVLALYKNIDSTLLSNSKNQTKNMVDYFEKNYESQHTIAKTKLASMKNLAKGKPSPIFKDYENFKGGKKSLDSFKGKYIYIDLWATWCKPCLGEIPALKTLEKKYHGKNITFLSISMDSERTSGSWENANKKWRKMVADKKLTGTHLFAGKDIDFMQDYQVTGIPRFILIDPKGNIVDASAPRPSDNQLIILFNALGI